MGNTKIDYSLPVVLDNNMAVMVPAHCIERMLTKLSYFDDIRPGTALARDIEIVRSHYINEAQRTNNIFELGKRDKKAEQHFKKGMLT